MKEYTIKDILSDLEQLESSQPSQPSSSSSIEPYLHPILQLGRSISSSTSTSPDSGSESDPDSSTFNTTNPSESQLHFQQLLRSFDTDTGSASDPSSASSQTVSNHVELASLFLITANQALELDQQSISSPDPPSQRADSSRDNDHSRIEALHGTIAKLQAREEERERSLVKALQQLEVPLT